jgi:hypothetical protein
MSAVTRGRLLEVHCGHSVPCPDSLGKRGKAAGCRRYQRGAESRGGGSSLGEFAAAAAYWFEEGEEVAHAQEGAEGWAYVNQFYFAATGAGGDVEGDDGAQASAVHEGDFFEVEDDALFVGDQGADFGAELRGVLESQVAVAFDDDGAIRAAGVGAESGCGDLGSHFDCGAIIAEIGS